MDKFKELFIKYLTTDIKGKANRVFNKDGKQMWDIVTLEMILYNFDKALEEYSKTK